MKQIGHDGYNPSSVAEWLDSIELGDYTKSFLINGYTSMDLVKKIWEIELINVSWLINSSSSSQICYVVLVLGHQGDHRKAICTTNTVIKCC